MVTEITFSYYVSIDELLYDYGNISYTFKVENFIEK